MLTNKKWLICLICLLDVLFLRSIACHDDQASSSDAESDASTGSDINLDLDPLTGEIMPSKSMFDYTRLFWYGCPKEAGIRSTLSHLYIVLVDSKTFEDVVVEIKQDDLKSSVEELVAKGFNLNQPSVLYAPGWKEHKDTAWIRRIKRRYAKQFKEGKRKTTYNLLIYNYPEDNSDSYKQVVSKVPEIGKALADFMNALKEHYDYRMSRVHMLGFSLSTHIVGAAGKLLGQSGNPVRQITALDPAGPCFFGSSDFAKEYTISRESASLVVARHYGFGVLGARRSVGGIDVFVNGGYMQPESIRKMHQFYILPTSQQNHRSSAFHEALAVLNGTCYDIAYECENYKMFLDGACADCDDPTKCFHIGSLIRGSSRAPLPDYKPGTRMYINAAGKNYCLHHYQLVVILSRTATPETIAAFQKGKVGVNLGAGIDEVTPKRTTTCDGEMAFTSLVTSKNQLNLDDVDLTNKKTQKYIDTSEIKMIKLNYMSHPFKAEREKRSVSLCPFEPDFFSKDACKNVVSNAKCF